MTTTMSATTTFRVRLTALAATGALALAGCSGGSSDQSLSTMQ